MSDEQFVWNIKVNTQDDLNQLAARAKNAQKAVEDLEQAMEKTSDVRTSNNAQASEYNNLLQQIYNQEGAQATKQFAKQAGIDYRAWAQSVGLVADQHDRLNLLVQRTDDDVAMIAKNFTGLIGTGRALAELGRAGSIVGRLIDDKDLSRVSQLTVAIGELVMVTGRLPQVASVLGLSMRGLGVLGAGVAGVAALSQAAGVNPVATGGGGALESGRQTGAEARAWLQSIGVQLPNLGEGLSKAINGTDSFANHIQDAANALIDYNNTVFDQKRKLDKIESEGTLNATSSLLAMVGRVASPLGLFGIKQPYDELSMYSRQRAATVREQNTPAGQLRGAISEGNVGVVDRMFPTNAMDLSKYSAEEIAQAKQMSAQATQSELEALRQGLLTTGLNRDEIEQIVKLRRDEIDAMKQLITIQGQSSYISGQEANHLSEMLSAIRANEAEKKKSESNFQFQRLKNVDPSQFGELSARAQMYDRFLSNIGSPEKQMHINLLMGENNTFKTMNVRMTALQLALEDLTKVEKAQLSGTWNLPAGATALVPIQSLDLQRWNKSGGGGMSEEALRALLGATEQSGDQVSQSTQTAADRIIQAIYNAALKSGIRGDALERIQQAKTPQEAMKIAHDTTIEQVNEGLSYKAKIEALMRASLGARPSSVSDYEDASERDYRLRRVPMDQARAAQQAVNVTVSALPVKATMNANVMVLLNGSVVARTLVPLFYDLFVKMMASSGTTRRTSVR